MPLVALVAVAGFEIVSSVETASDARAQEQLATSAVGPGSFLTNLQNERNRAAIDLIGMGGATTLPVDDDAEARGLTDASLMELRAEIDSNGADEVAEAFAPAFAALDDLQSVRDEIDAHTGPLDTTNRDFADTVFTRYTRMTEAFFDAVSTVSLSVDGSTLRNGVQIVDAAARQSEIRARIVREVVFASIGGTLDTAPVRQEVAAMWDRSLGFDDTIRASALGPYAGVADETLAEPGVIAFQDQIQSYLDGAPLDITPLLDSARTTDDTGYSGLRVRAAAVLDAEASAVIDAATARQRLFMGVAAGGVVVALLLMWLTSRSITRPLRSLRAQADEMAETRLPAAVQAILDTPMGDDVLIPPVVPIKVKTHDEVRDVAAALNVVQRRALDLAVEQAVLRRNISDSFVNLGRRNQNLLNRQLELITELENAETDPDELASLFRLDHLATRMRRNAESLLVLAGIDPPRQWSAPVDIADVVRSALGEVEDYQRVLVRQLEPATLVGSAAADIGHVLAELLENGLTFSPPEQQVEVKGRLTPNGYTIAITDNGVGMRPEEIERANTRLAGDESFTVAPSRYLGHYVAGHLAQRHGIQVDLQDDPAGGTLARVIVPIRLVNDPGAGQGSVDPLAVLDPARPALGSELGDAHDEPDALDDEREGDTVTSPASEILPPADDDAWLPAAEEWPADPAPVAPTVPSATGGGEPHVARHLRPRQRAGFGGLAAAAAPPAEAPPSEACAPAGAAAPPEGPTRAAAAGSGATTPSGLARRVPGAQRPDVATSRATGTAAVATEPAPTSTPDDVYSFLSSFSSGVERGRADAGAMTDDEGGEDR
jgi:signal transduction histidine kinase